VDPNELSVPPGSGLQELQSFRAEVFSRKDLPTIPVVLARILAVVEGEHSSARDLVEVVERDQALTSRILKLANSALFGLSRKVATVPRAVVLVGFNTVRNLALGVKVWNALATGGRQREQVEALWRHSALVAAAGTLIASRVRGCEPGISFTAGLLHDVGKLVLSLKLGMRYWSLVEAATDATQVAALERAHLQIDHAEVGGWLAEAWRLPPEIVSAIRDHHADGFLERPEWSVADVVAAANRLVHGTDVETGALEPAAADVLERTAARGLGAEHWAQHLGQLRAEAESIAELFAG
jgi:putative nucleotidyltransferase with HDIG domain